MRQFGDHITMKFLIIALPTRDQDPFPTRVPRRRLDASLK
jgi:hypothetical protein